MKDKTSKEKAKKVAEEDLKKADESRDNLFEIWESDSFIVDIEETEEGEGLED